MSEAPRRLIKAIRKAGITVDPSHAAFRSLAHEVWQTIQVEAGEVLRSIGGRRDRIIDLLVDEVEFVRLGALYKSASPERITDSIISFRDAVRGKAAALITERKCELEGDADAPPPRVHDRRPMRRPKGRKWF